MKTICLHIGTHKTGTKTIQSFVNTNVARLDALGIQALRAGRHRLSDQFSTPGHHEIAWDFAKGDDSSHFREALAEIQAHPAPVIFVSSEEFHPLWVYPHRIRSIVDGFASIGYQTKVLVYLRNQARYAESLYAECSKTTPMGPFDTYVNDILERGEYQHGSTNLAFEYTRILDAFRHVVGESNMIVRPYRTDRGTDFMVSDVLGVLAQLRGIPTIEGLANPNAVENASQSLGQLIARIAISASREPDLSGIDANLLNSRFVLVDREEIVRFVNRFRADNDRVLKEYGCAIPFVSEAEIPPPGIKLWDDTQQHRTVLAHTLKPRAATARRTVCLHIGTHKTGTKTIQSFLNANRALLEQAGVYVPETGRHRFTETSASPGQHEIAWDFLRGDGGPHFQALLEELEGSLAPFAVLSSESFHPLHIYPHRLKTIADGLRSIGYEPQIVIYLREQSRYAESLFAEFSKTEFVGDFDRYLDEVIRGGSFVHGNATHAFDYTHILRAFEEAFGSSNVTVRPYRTDLGADFLLNDFLAVLALLKGGLRLTGFSVPNPMANPRQSLGLLLTRIHAVALVDVNDADRAADEPLAALVNDSNKDTFSHRLSLITREEMLRTMERFREDNLQLRDEFQCSLTSLSENAVPALDAPIWEETRLQRAILTDALEFWGLR